MYLINLFFTRANHIVNGLKKTK